MKYFETTNFQKNTERQFVPKNLWNKLWGFFGSKFIRSLQFFLLIFRIHMSTFIERKKKCKRGKEKVVQKWKVRSNWDSNSPTVINLKMTYI